MKNSHLLIGLVIALALCTGGFFWMKQSLKQAEEPSSSVVAGITVGGDFTLVNQDGKTVTQKDYQGRYLFVYFGFTFCPAICPTELHKMTQVLKSLSAEQRANIQPLFITVDPERDTVAVMKNYISLFHEDFDALTGTPEQVKAIMKNWKAFATKAGDTSGDEYTVDHSSYIYFLAPDGDLKNLFRIQDTSDAIERDVKASLKR